MKVTPKIDRKTGDIVLLYPSKLGKGFDAEVYQFHDTKRKIATHFNAQGMKKKYLSTLADPTAFDKEAVDKAMLFYSDIVGEQVIEVDRTFV